MTRRPSDSAPTTRRRRRPSTHLLRSGLVAALVLGGAGMQAIAAAASTRTAPGWHVSKAFSPASDQVVDTACPTTAACFALMSAPVFAGTTNGGASWKVGVMPAAFRVLSTGGGIGGNPFEDMSCPTASVCFVLGEDNGRPELASTSDAGAKWTLRSLPSAFNAALTDGTPAAIACQSAVVCNATTTSGASSGSVLRTINAAAGWTKTDPSTSFAPQWIACSPVVASKSSCGVIGDDNFLHSVNGGASWSARALPAGVAGDEISCPSAAECLAASTSLGAIAVTTTSGASWHESTIAGATAVEAVSCGTSSDCEAVGSQGVNGSEPGIWRTTTAGKSWAAQHVPALSDGFHAAYGPSVNFDAISCEGADDCLSGGTAQTRFISFYVFTFLARTTNAGAAWKQQHVATAVSALAAVSCASGADCEVVGSHPTGVAIGTTRSGAAWTVQAETIPEVGGNYEAVSCASTKACVAVGSRDTGPTSGIGVIARTTDGGVKWTTTPEANAFDLSGVACPSTKVCFAVGLASSLSGGILLKTSNGGASWGSESVPAGTGRLTEVACASTTHCESVGDSGVGGADVIGTSNGVGWTKQTLPKTLGMGSFLDGVACPTTKLCQAVGGTINGPGVIIRTSNGGATWTLVAVPPGTGQLNGVSCSSAGSCDAAGASRSASTGVIVASTNGGTSWKAQTLPSGTGPVDGISCPTAKQCYAAGVTTGNGGLILALG